MTIGTTLSNSFYRSFDDTLYSVFLLKKNNLTRSSFFFGEYQTIRQIFRVTSWVSLSRCGKPHWIGRWLLGRQVKTSFAGFLFWFLILPSASVTLRLVLIWRFLQDCRLRSMREKYASWNNRIQWNRNSRCTYLLELLGKSIILFHIFMKFLLQKFWRKRRNAICPSSKRFAILMILLTLLLLILKLYFGQKLLIFGAYVYFAFISIRWFSIACR